ncbi:MAG: NAD(P)-binding domain-containing protein, partial [Ilumatobacteraceae bacterium]
MTSQLRCGFIGLGHIGKHLAASLLRGGFAVSVHDLNKSAADPLIAAGATWAGTIGEVCANSDTVFTCLPTPEAIAAVVDGANGVLAALADRGVPGTWVDM